MSGFHVGKRVRWMAGRIFRALAWLLLTILIVWALLALWFDGSSSPWLAGLFCFLFTIGCALLFVFMRPVRRAMLAVAGALALVAIWWAMIPPRNDRDWAPEVSRLAQATIQGDRLTVENVRNFSYRSENDFTPRWETRMYSLNNLQGVDLFLCFWGPTLIAHTIASWEFSDGPPLAISIETRKEKGESYSALRGFFKQYELYYVVADERDMIRLRTNYRNEQVYLYPIRIKRQDARALLLDYLRSVDRLRKRPRWYNALTQNCTTTIRSHVMHTGSGNPWDWRILANGHIDELGYERGTIDTSLPFPEMRLRSDITARAQAVENEEDFSRSIRQGLPGGMRDLAK